MTEEQTLSLYRSLKRKVIAFNPNYAVITGIKKMSNLTNKEYIEKNQGAGILLSQLEYWFEKMNYQEFYKKDEELVEECATNITAFKRDKKTLIDLGFISYIRKGIPCKGYWIINESKVIERLSALVSVCLDSNKLESLNSSKQESLDSNKLESLNSSKHYLAESTTYNTTYNIKKTSNKFDAETYIQTLDISLELKESLIGLIEIRKIKKTATSQRSIDMIIKDLQSWYNTDILKQIKCVNQSVKSGWTGVFEIKENTSTGNSYQSNDWRDKRTKYETPDELKGY